MCTGAVVECVDHSLDFVLGRLCASNLFLNLGDIPGIVVVGCPGKRRAVVDKFKVRPARRRVGDFREVLIAAESHPRRLGRVVQRDLDILDVQEKALKCSVEECFPFLRVVIPFKNSQKSQLLSFLVGRYLDSVAAASLVKRRTEFCERTPAYASLRGGGFLLQREQHYILRRVAATYTLSTGVDSRATHGILPSLVRRIYA